MAHLATLKTRHGRSDRSHTTSVYACTLLLHVVITVICPDMEEDYHIHTTSVHVHLYTLLSLSYVQEDDHIHTTSVHV